MTDTPENDFDELDLNAGADLDEDADDLAPLDAVIAERDEWRDKALRLAAEVENIKRRSEREANDARAYAIQRFAQGLLGVSRALGRGLEMTEKSLLQAFEANNLKRVAPEPGETFDPHLHQAMMEQPSDTIQGGQVVQTLQAGYALFGRTVRPAMVVVAAKGSGAAAGNAAYAKAADLDGGNFDGKA